MLDPDVGYGDELIERVPNLLPQDVRGSSINLDARRRIEHLRELKRLRELLDDPDFDDLN